jgi:hypothetical protein
MASGRVATAGFQSDGLGLDFSLFFLYFSNVSKLPSFLCVL